MTREWGQIKCFFRSVSIHGIAQRTHRQWFSVVFHRRAEEKCLWLLFFFFSADDLFFFSLKYADLVAISQCRGLKTHFDVFCFFVFAACTWFFLLLMSFFISIPPFDDAFPQSVCDLYSIFHVPRDPMGQRRRQRTTSARIKYEEILFISLLPHFFSLSFTPFNFSRAKWRNAKEKTPRCASQSWKRETRDVCPVKETTENLSFYASFSPLLLFWLYTCYCSVRNDEVFLCKMKANFPLRSLFFNSFSDFFFSLLFSRAPQLGWPRSISLVRISVLLSLVYWRRTNKRLYDSCS